MNYCGKYNIMCFHHSGKRGRGFCHWSFKRKCPGRRHVMALKLKDEGIILSEMPDAFITAMVSQTRGM